MQADGLVPNFAALQALALPGLDADAWLAAAQSFGARYAVLVADHMTGFALWPTRAHNASVASTAWRGGKGDVVRDFLTACAARGVAPGVFYSTHFNWVLGVNNYAVGWPRLFGGPTLTQREAEDVMLAQLEELAAYQADAQPWAEIWFDGGVDTVITPRVGPAVRALFPTAMCHSCSNFSQANATSRAGGRAIRWMGNEEGAAPLPSWGASSAALQPCT